MQRQQESFRLQKNQKPAVKFPVSGFAAAFFRKAVPMSEHIEFCKGGGCTAKLGAGVLAHVLERLPKGPLDKNLIIGYDSRDDAAVYRISDDVAIVQTLDFFRRC